MGFPWCRAKFGPEPPYAKGSRVVIPKGTIIKSTYPGWPMKGQPAGRTYEVIVHSSSLERTTNDGGVVVEEGRVTWAGAAGYWKWCDVHAIRPAPSDLEKLAAAGKK